MDKDISNLAKDMIYCDFHDLLDDDLGVALSLNFEANNCDATLAQMIESRVRGHKYKSAFQGANPFRNPKLTQGDYVIGRDMKGNVNSSMPIPCR